MMILKMEIYLCDKMFLKKLELKTNKIGTAKFGALKMVFKL